MNKVHLLLFIFVFTFPITVSLYSKNIIYAGDLAEPESLDPAQAWDETSSYYITNIFDTLVEFNPQTQKIVPSLATSWKTTNNGKNWQFKLRKGVKFHDGTPFNADSVIFSFKRQMDKAFSFRYYDFPMFHEIFSYLKDVRKIDHYNVAFFLSESFYPFLASLTVDCAAIVSPNAIKEKKAKFRIQPIGTGPFKLKEWIKEKRIVLEANMEYWQGKPKIEKYITIIEPNLDVLLNLFKNHKIDILHSYSISKMVSFKGLSWVSISNTPTLSINFIAFNMKKPYLKNIAVRKALNYLWNKQILRLVYQNHVIPTTGLFPQGMAGYFRKEEKYPLSIEKAHQLLKNEDPEWDFPLDFILLKDSRLELQMVSLFAKNLKKVGIKLTIHRVSIKEYQKRISNGEYDLTISGWIADYPDSDSIISPLFSKKLQNEGFANLSTANSENILSLIYKARKESNQKIREEIYMKLNKIVLDRALFIPLFQSTNVIIYHNKIAKIEKNPLGNTDLFYLEIK